MIYPKHDIRGCRRYNVRFNPDGFSGTGGSRARADFKVTRHNFEASIFAFFVSSFWAPKLNPKPETLHP